MLIFFASGNTDSQHTDSLQDGAGVGWDERSELYYQAALLRKSETPSFRIIHWLQVSHYTTVLKIAL